MEENSKEKKEVKKITYEEVCEEALLTLMDEKISKVASSLSKEELIKEFNKIKNTVLKNPTDFETARDNLIGVYKSKGLYAESTDPRVIAQRKLMAVESRLNRGSTVDEEDWNFGY